MGAQDGDFHVVGQQNFHVVGQLKRTLYVVCQLHYH